MWWVEKKEQISGSTLELISLCQGKKDAKKKIKQKIKPSTENVKAKEKSFWNIVESLPVITDYNHRTGRLLFK
jgi:hypothetical protein